MSKGVLLFSHSSGQYDYSLFTEECARRVKKFLNVPVCLVTSDDHQFNYVDQVIKTAKPDSGNIRVYNDHVTGEFINHDRVNAFDLSPFDQTLVIDVDYLLLSDDLSRVWNLDGFKIATNAVTFKGKSINVTHKNLTQVWATVMYFDRSEVSKTVFEIAKDVLYGWDFYSAKYEMPITPVRNDFVFALALRFLKLRSNSDTNLNLSIITANKNNEIVSMTDESIIFKGFESTPILSDVHVLNKQSLYDTIRHVNSLQPIGTDHPPVKRSRRKSSKRS